MIELGNKNEKIKNKDRCNYCHQFPILTFLGDNHHLTLLYIAKTILYLHETSKRIDEFAIGYMINITLNANKSFK